MPTLLRIDGMRVVIYPNDHRPAHVHVRSADGEAVFLLHCPQGPPELRESFRLDSRHLSRIKEALTSALAVLCDKWRLLHGRY